jgi:ubiquitin carboxyl-terminal hydrolase 5/13
MASVIQVLFSLPAFQHRYQPSIVQREHWATCPEQLPASCIECQMYKLADGLLSGRYSRPSSRNTPSHNHETLTPEFQDGIKPTGFKALIGKGHPEFSTMKQQDSEEFLTYLITSLRRHAKKVSTSNPQPTEVFAFGMEQRLQCSACNGVRYRVDPMDVVSVVVPAREAGKDQDKVIWSEVGIEECLDGLTAVEDLEYKCPVCGKNVIATK